MDIKMQTKSKTTECPVIRGKKIALHKQKGKEGKGAFWQSPIVYKCQSEQARSSDNFFFHDIGKVVSLSLRIFKEHPNFYSQVYWLKVMSNR